MAGGGTERTGVTVAQIDHLAKGGQRAGLDHMCACAAHHISYRRFPLNTFFCY